MTERQKDANGDNILSFKTALQIWYTGIQTAVGRAPPSGQVHPLFSKFMYKLVSFMWAKGLQSGWSQLKTM